MCAARLHSHAPASDAVRVINPGGASAYVVACDHASNFLPAKFGTLGLPEAELERHIAWDPGALPVSLALSEMLDAAVVESRISRLAIDCNRPVDAPDLVPAISETTAIPGNAALSAAAREERIALSHRPYHDALERLIDERLAAVLDCQLVAVHTFTPVYRGVSRPWHIGIIHDDDVRLAAPLIAALRELPGVEVGVNQPYSPADRVYYTMERHARARGLPCVMIEIRNDELADAAGQRLWADRLASALSRIRADGPTTPAADAAVPAR